MSDIGASPVEASPAEANPPAAKDAAAAPSAVVPATGSTPADRRLGRDFYARPAREVARDLIGRRLVRLDAGRRLSGRIVETEAYCDAEEPDLACHAKSGRPSPRTAVMFGAPGFAYVYFTYGMHWMLNLITGQSGRANGVLIRALAPEEGLERMAARRVGPDGRPRPAHDWCSGPARLSQALAIDRRQDGLDLCNPATTLWVEPGAPPTSEAVARGPRIGLGRTPEPWLSMPWRFGLADDPNLSRPMLR